MPVINKSCRFLRFLFSLWAAGAIATLSAQDPDFATYLNTPIQEVLDHYEGLTKKHLIRDAAINQTATITMTAHGVSKDEMVGLIESTLMLNGIAIVSIDDHTSKAILIGATKNPRSEGIKVFTDEKDFPPGEQVISYYMPLEYLGPQEALSIFLQQSPPHSYGVYVAAPSSQALVLTENAGTIRGLIALQKLLDVPPKLVVNEYVRLQNSDATKVASMVNRLLDGKPDNATVVAAPLAEGILPPASTSSMVLLPSESNLLVGPARVIPDARSNRIFLITRPYNLPFLEGLITMLDEPGEFQTPQRRQLRYVQAQDILSALRASLASGEDESTGEVPAAALERRTTLTPPVPFSEISNGQSTGNNSTYNGGNTTITPPLREPNESNVPSVITVGRTRILADNPSNSIIVFGTSDAVTKVFSLIDELDRQPLQVYLSAIIGQLQLTKNSEIGVDLLLKYVNTGKTGLAGSSINSPGTISANNIPNPTSLITNSAFPVPSGLTLYGVLGNNLNSYIRALESTNRFSVISRPSVFTTNNKLAIIATGSQIPVPGSTTSGITGTDSTLVTTSNIQYQNVLLRLDIIPLINAEHQVTLKIRQINDSIGSNQTISGNSVPTILTQEINTEVTLADKSTVVIGGLISDTKQKTVDGVPFLSSIPILGNLFKDTVDNKSRSELIVMIQPTVIENEGDRLAVNEDVKRRTMMQLEMQQAISGTLDGEKIKKKKAPPAGTSPSLLPLPDSSSPEPQSFQAPPELRPPPPPE